MLAALAAPVLAAAAAPAPSVRTVAGEVVVEPATLANLGFEWRIKGDANRNASVAVSYRKKGETAWREALPMLRLGGEEIKQGESYNVVVPDMFAGSVMDLAENTAYEVRLKLADPDGVTGVAEKIVSVRTKAEPMPAAGGRVFHVYPRDYKGTKQEPAFTGLLAAYNMGANGADWVNTFLPRVKPGDVILVHAGLYKDDRHRYAGPNETLFDGTMYLTASGTADKPIVIKAAGDGEVVFDGDGNHNLFNLQAANYTYFEGITVQHTDVGFDLGHKRIGGAVGFTLKHSKLVDVGRGVFTDWGGARDFYIADNVFVGRNDPNRLMGWIGKTWAGKPGFPQPLLSEYAVKVFGSGHVIAYNKVSGFHDGLDHATYGDPDDWPNTPRDRMPVAIDFYNNDVSNVDDNCIETDGSAYNVRVLRNRCFNSAHRTLSTQPVLGGPVYFVRNIVYHAPEGGALKLTANSAGVVLYNNTFLAEAHQMGPVANTHYRNNLILGQGAWPEVFSVETFTNYSTSDYNGFRPNPGQASAFALVAPPPGVARDYAGKRETKSFKTLADYAAATGQDRHSVLVDFDVFRKASPPDPADPTKIYSPADFDFQLKAGSTAVDAGVVLPNVTDGFTGKAPDLGAYEVGVPPPHYGPRP